VFFFSSRRRHTRSKRDWSSDVCSSDLVVRTHALSSTIGARATVGPFTYLRPGTELGEEGKLGGFVETKNATIGRGSKVPHLTYEIGRASCRERVSSADVGVAETRKELG